MLSRKFVVLAILLPTLVPLLTTGINIFNGADFPEDKFVEPLEEHERISEGVLLIVLDGLPGYILSLIHI